MTQTIQILMMALAFGLAVRYMNGDIFIGMFNGFLMGILAASKMFRKDIEDAHRLREKYEPEPYEPPSSAILGLRDQ